MIHTAPALRPPHRVMRLARFGAMFPTRLSFLRRVVHRLADERAEVSRGLWDMDADGIGRAVYTVPFGGHLYSLVAITKQLADEDRTDRVIATAWDAAFVLYDGIPDGPALEQIAANAPLQEAGRQSERVLVLSRANKSTRLWDGVTSALRAGRAPDLAQGYLMRTTAVYGNGKFGLADRAAYAGRPGMGGSFAAEMLTVWLIRHFTHDLAEHVGQGRLSAPQRRTLGIGNATGLGMAPFLVSHPVLLHNWMVGREAALARALSLPLDTARLGALGDEAAHHLQSWQVPDPAHQARINRLRADWSRARTLLLPHNLNLGTLMARTASLSVEAEELMAALLIEAAGPAVDDLAVGMTDATGPLASLPRDTDTLRRILQDRYAWALRTPYAQPLHCQRFWYVSANKLEPRLGNRHTEAGAELESPLDIARRAAALHADLPASNTSVADFLDERPQHLLAIQRAAIAARYPYAEIQDNLIAHTCRPIDLLRAKLALFGATGFDPKSDLWTRITLGAGMPLAEDVAMGAEARWLPA
ncbi:MAG: hypothetical protein AAGM84_16740 [Pseudomonadota bacterium]